MPGVPDSSVSWPVQALFGMLDAIAVPVIGLSDDWRCAFANRAAATLLTPDNPAGIEPSSGLGLGAGGLIGRPFTSLFIGADAAIQQFRRGVGAESLDPAAGDAALRGVKLARTDRAAVVDVDVVTLARMRLESDSRIQFGLTALATIVDVSSRSGAETEVLRLRASLAEAERASQRLQTLQAELVDDGAKGHEMVGTSAALQRVRDQVARVAPTDTTVLVRGETGSGKELVARSIHAGSKRRGNAFIAVNCAALPESLIESELFGHEKGAFTGADRRRLGKFELADGGTLFLDEIAELPLQAQAKLLRVIQESAFERVGGAETVRVNVRLLAATHRDLARQVERGRFREDLFYRLNVFRIEVPPLRDRKEDLRELASHLHERVARRMGKAGMPISDLSLRRIMAYPWPGNVRELANAVERATLLAEGSELEIELPESPLTALGDGGGGVPRMGAAGGVGGGPGVSATRDILLDLTLEQLQRLQITHALESCGYRVFGSDGAAERLDLNPNTLLSKMDKFGIPRPRLMKRAKKG